MIRVSILQDGSPLPPVHVAKSEIIIGRGVEADVQLTSEAVSRRHARLSRTPEGWQVADLGSANGVYVAAGGAAPERVVIKVVRPGDQLHIESFVLSFEEVQGSAEAANLADQRDMAEPGKETQRTQFISMTDVLAARQAMSQATAETTPPLRAGAAPQIAAAVGTGAAAMSARPASGSLGGPAPAHGPAAGTSGAEGAAVGGTWWVHVSSDRGHARSFTIASKTAQVGAASHCEIRLPEGPKAIVELERAGEGVGLRRLSLWPFPRVQVDGRSVREAILVDGDSFSVGGSEVRIHLRAPPTRVVR